MKIIILFLTIFTLQLNAQDSLFKAPETIFKLEDFAKQFKDIRVEGNPFLYAGCYNNLKIITPNLDSVLLINATANNCTVFPKEGGGRGSFIFVPDLPSEYLEQDLEEELIYKKTIFNGDSVEYSNISIFAVTVIKGWSIVLLSQKYTVINPPLPKILAFKESTLLKINSKVKPKDKLTFTLEPDSLFESILPQDCIYKLFNIKVLVGDSLLEILNEKEINRDYKSYARPKIDIHLEKYKLKKGQVVKVVFEEIIRGKFNIKLDMSDEQKTMFFEVE